MNRSNTPEPIENPTAQLKQVEPLKKRGLLLL